MTGKPIDAVLFDLDGVLTPTARLHEAAWAAAIDEFLATLDDGQDRSPFRSSDYLEYIDGRPRIEGLAAFLESRGISPPLHPEAKESASSIHSLAESKNHLFRRLLTQGAAEPYPEVPRVLAELRDLDFRLGVVSSSRNARAVLKAAALDTYFDVTVDGITAAREDLDGKPSPDPFLYAAAELGVAAGGTCVVEDAVVGVEAAAAGGFGLVVGVRRRDSGPQLADRGADVVVGDLSGLSDVLANRGALRG